MKSVRRPVVALSTMLVLVVIQAIADPTGLLALVGWSGALPQARRAVDAGRRTSSTSPCCSASSGGSRCAPATGSGPSSPGVVLAVHARAGRRVLRHDVGSRDRRLGGGLRDREGRAGRAHRRRVHALVRRPRPSGRSTSAGSIWLPAIALRRGRAAASPGCGGRAPSTRPASRPRDPTAASLSVIVAMVLIAGATALCLRWMRARVPGVLGGWLAALVAGGAVGHRPGDRRARRRRHSRATSGRSWPTYVAVADGLSFGACVGWIVGVSAVLADRVRVSPRGARAAARRRRRRRRRGGRHARRAAERRRGRGIRSDESRARGLPARRWRRHRRRRRQPGAAARRQREPARRLLPAARRRRRHLAADRGGLRRHRRAGLQRRAARHLVVGARARARRRSTRPTSTRSSEAVDLAKEHGLYVVLDMHQDSWWNEGTAEGTECRPGTDPMWGYDGAPEWATITDGAPRCQFQGRDISPASDRAFQNFYFDTDGVQSALVETWAQARRGVRATSPPSPASTC